MFKKLIKEGTLQQLQGVIKELLRLQSRPLEKGRQNFVVLLVLKLGARVPVGKVYTEEARKVKVSMIGNIKFLGSSCVSLAQLTPSC